MNRFARLKKKVETKKSTNPKIKINKEKEEEKGKEYET